MEKNNLKKILFILGTRPEAIKCAPLILGMKKHPKLFDVFVCNTAQHREMTDRVLSFFNIIPDYDFDIMKRSQTLFDITERCLKGMEKILKNFKPDISIVQGDTTTAFAGSLASFYAKIPVAHLEAGLRTGNIYSPFPEEVNRKFVSAVTTYHFAPTKSAVENLHKENTFSNVWLVGNTVIDALQIAVEKVRKNHKNYEKKFSFLDAKKKTILVTGHRRENFGQGIKHIAEALKSIASQRRDDVQIVYPVHLNPNVKGPVHEYLGKNSNIHLLPPVEYPEMIWLLDRAHIVLTDSGGIQEEAPALGKPVLVMREDTERPEGIKQGTAVLVGTDSKKIIDNVLRLLDNKKIYKRMAKEKNPYGDGSTSEKIISIMKNI